MLFTHLLMVAPFVVRVTITDVDGMSASCEHRVTATRRPNNNPDCGSVSPSKR